VAAAEAILAGDQGGRRALFLVYGTVIGVVLSWVPVPAAVIGLSGAAAGVPMSAFGTAFIGNLYALTMFGVGLLARAYAQPYFGVDLNALYIPHGMMIGAGLVALIQVVVILTRRSRGDEAQATEPATAAPQLHNPSGAVAAPIGPIGESVAEPAASPFTRSEDEVRRGLVWGAGLYIGAAVILALISGMTAEMSIGMLIVWVLFAAFACIAAEFIVGLSAMHAGWFPAFATALIFLVLGMIIGFPAPALAVLVGFVASGGPAFADAGYDLKAGWLLRGGGRNPRYERYGRYQQILAGLTGLAVGWVIVAFFHNVYFAQDLFPPVDRVYATTINAGVDPSVLQNLLIWAIPGAIIQAIGGPSRQMGILFATGLLILNPRAGWAVLIGILIRIALLRWKGKQAETPMTIMAAGFIAGDALWGFFDSVYRSLMPRR
jgi:uncharacterized oligopeptide transporter (OPT) family protein